MSRFGAGPADQQHDVRRAGSGDWSGLFHRGGAVGGESGDDGERGVCGVCGCPRNGGGGVVACAGGDGLGDGERGAGEQCPPRPWGSPPCGEDAAGVDEADVAVADGGGSDAVQDLAGCEHRHDPGSDAQQMARLAVGEGCGAERCRDGERSGPAGRS